MMHEDSQSARLREPRAARARHLSFLRWRVARRRGGTWRNIIFFLNVFEEPRLGAFASLEHCRQVGELGGID